MSGIFGLVITSPGEGELRGALARMESASSYPLVLQRDKTPPSSCVADPCGVGAAPFHDRQYATATLKKGGHSSTIAFHGSLYGPDDLLAGPEPSLATRLLSAAWNEGPASFLARLRGEFAIALWDGSERTLYLASDPFRVHSLVYSIEGGTLAFASRMGTLLASGYPRDRSLSSEAIVDIVGSSVVPTPRTIYRAVRKLPPGALLVYREGQASLTTYWDADFRHPRREPVSALEEEVRRSLREAVRLRLRREHEIGRVGAFLSGGIDSSTVTGILAQETDRPVQTFSIGFAEDHFNEIEYARIVARRFGAEHREYFVTAKDTVEAIPSLLQAFDEPFANASAIPTYWCARFAREQGVDTLYAGDGGDELFAGNERYVYRNAYVPYWRLPKPLREGIIRPLVHLMAAGVPLPLFAKARRYVDRARLTEPERMTAHALLRVIPMASLFAPEFLSSLDPDYAPYQMLGRHYDRALAEAPLDRELYADLKITISDNDVPKVVRMTEAAGVTVRFPFLDARFAELAVSIPAREKLKGRELRVFFKRAYADLLPPETIRKKKHGFGLPIPIWLRTDPTLAGMLREALFAPTSRIRPWFRAGALEDLHARHQTDTTSFYGTVLWNLLVLDQWLRTRS